MIRLLLITILIIDSSRTAPQFVTFKDGKVGVNFGGFVAEAGLGGLLTGDASHGGLSASAGTPGGQRVAAGLDGLLNGQAGGKAYAGAQATDTVGASAIIGGSTDPRIGGIAGAESHSNGHSITKTIISGNNNEIKTHNEPNSADLPVPTDLPTNGNVQKVKPPKKFFKTTRIENRFYGAGDNVDTEKQKHFQARMANPDEEHPGHLPANNYLNIPIRILEAIRDTLPTVGLRKLVH